MTPISIRIRHQTVGAHVHCVMFVSEFGPGTTHGRSGHMVFRPAEFEAFRSTLIAGEASTGHRVTFVEVTYALCAPGSDDPVTVDGEPQWPAFSAALAGESVRDGDAWPATYPTDDE